VDHYGTQQALELAKRSKPEKERKQHKIDKFIIIKRSPELSLHIQFADHRTLTLCDLHNELECSKTVLANQRRQSMARSNLTRLHRNTASIDVRV